MARIRKGPDKYWSKEEKLKIINEVLLNSKSFEEVAKEYDISAGMLIGWINFSFISTKIKESWDHSKCV